jgi:hypothetical protein
MCSFSINYSGAARDVVSKARSMIEDAGGSFSGDEIKGLYTVKLPLGDVQGEYTVETGRLAFKITKKPMLVPCAAIETYLRSKIS